MQNLTIKKRLYVGALFMAAAMLVLLCLNIYSVWRASHSLQTVYEGNVVPTAALVEMEGQIKEIRFRLAGYAISQLSGVGNRNHLKEARRTVTHAWALFKSGTTDQGPYIGDHEQALIAQIDQHLPSADRVFDRLDHIYAEYDQKAALSLLEDEWPYVIHLGVLKPIAQLLPIQQSGVRDIYQTTRTQWQRMLVLTLVILVVVMAGLTAFTLRLVSAITAPLTLAVNVTKRIAEGDMDTPIAVQSRDEVGQLLESFSHMRHQIKTRQQRLETILDTAAEGIVTFDSHGMIESFNQAAEKLFGYGHEEMRGKHVGRLIVSGDQEGRGQGDLTHVLFTDQHAVNNGDELLGQRQDGTVFPMELKVSSMVLQEQSFYTALISDITERKRAEDRFRRVVESAPNAILLVNRDGRITLVNAQAETLFGYAREALIGQSVELLVPDRFRNQHPGHRAGFFADPSARAMGTGRDLYGLHRDGREFPIEIGLNPIETDEGPVVLASIIDITERKQAESALKQAKEELEARVLERTAKIVSTNEQLRAEISERTRAEKALEEQAVRDPLTGLYNRRFYTQRIREDIARAKRAEHIIAILVCDLDGFKAINDTHGHHTGDKILTAIAQILLAATRGADGVFRWGGDEFVVVLPDSSRDGLLVVAERIRKSVRELNSEGCSGVDVTIGAALYPEHGIDPEELVRLADRALYIAKKGGDKVHIGEEEYRLDDHSIQVVFQPVIDVRLHQILGYEALSRDPQGKYNILALFRKYHAIGKLHELKCLCFRLQTKAAQEAGLERLFLNVDFTVLKTLDVPPKPPEMEVVLEISEGEALQDVENHLEVARKWRSAGYKFAIDDFGAGFVSLPFIARLVPDYIKLDRATVVQAVSSNQFMLVLQDLIHALRRTCTDGIIAEGIETQQELSVMKSLGIYLIQGYLFGKPQAWSELRTEGFPPPVRRQLKKAS